jgi:hypothetical protein
MSDATGLYTMRLVMESKVEVDNKGAHQEDTKDSRTPEIIISTDHTTIDHPKGGKSDLSTQTIIITIIITYHARFSKRYRA